MLSSNKIRLAVYRQYAASLNLVVIFEMCLTL